MNKAKVLIVILMTSISITAHAGVTAWEDSPSNWDNSPRNWENSSRNWENSPRNWDNSPSNFGNDRIIRNESGQPQGYAVPKADGGVNFYDASGNRTGYLPSRK